LFEAATASAWREALIARGCLSQNWTDSNDSYFQMVVALSQIYSEIQFSKSLGSESFLNQRILSRLSQMRSWLANLRDSSKPGSSQLTASASMLWHATCQSLYSDQNMIQIAVGRDGPEASQRLDELNSWVQTVDSRKAILHAAHILRHAMVDISSIPESGIHLSRVCFHAGLVLFAYIAVAPRPSVPEAALWGGAPVLDLSSEVDWEEIHAAESGATPSLARRFVDGDSMVRIAMAGAFEAFGPTSRRLDAMGFLATAQRLTKSVTSWGVGQALAETFLDLAAAV